MMCPDGHIHPGQAAGQILAPPLENAQFRSPRFTKIMLICLICFPKQLNKLEVVYHAYHIQSVTSIYLNQQQTLAIQCPHTLKCTVSVTKIHQNQANLPNLHPQTTK